MNEIKRKYYVADGPNAKALLEILLGLQDAHRDRIKAYTARYNAPLVMERRGYPTGILLEEGSTPPEGFKMKERHMHEGKVYEFFAPVGNTKAGREAKKAAAAVGEFKPGELICEHYGVANQRVFTAGAMHVAVGWPSVAKGVITLSVPQGEEDFTPSSPELREIKKSEYIAITEE